VGGLGERRHGLVVVRSRFGDAVDAPLRDELFGLFRAVGLDRPVAQALEQPLEVVAEAGHAALHRHGELDGCVVGGEIQRGALQALERRRLRAEEPHVAQVEVAGLGVALVVGAVDRRADAGEAAGVDQAGELRVHVVRDSVHTCFVQRQRCDAAVRRILDLRMANHDLRLGVRGVIAGNQVGHVGFAEGVRRAVAGGMRACKEDVQRGGGLVHGPHFRPVPQRCLGTEVPTLHACARG